MRQIRNIVSMIFAIPAIMMLFIPPMISMADNSLIGDIKGRVINATLDNKGIKGLEVILEPITKGKKMNERRTKTDPKGFFSFRGVRSDGNISYHLSTRYKNVDYTSRDVHFDRKKTQTLDLSVYETTNQDNDISIKMNHIFLDRENDFFQISEAVIIENKGNRVYVGSKDLSSGKKGTLRISLSKNATDLRFEPHAARFMINTVDGFIDTSEIMPGTKRVLFSYAIKADDLRYKLIKNMPFKTENLSVVFPDKGFIVKSNQVAFNKKVEDSGRQLFLMAGKDFAKGSQVILELNSVESKKLFPWIIVSMLVLFIAIGAVIPLIKRKNFQPSTDGQFAPKDSMNASDQRQAVIQAIAKLDDLAESGNIDPEIYKKKRDELLIKAKAFSRLLGSNAYSSSE